MKERKRLLGWIPRKSYAKSHFPFVSTNSVVPVCLNGFNGTKIVPFVDLVSFEIQKPNFYLLFLANKKQDIIISHVFVWKRLCQKRILELESLCHQRTRTCDFS